ncbi:MAG: hypothetical protein ACYS91_15775 [Planctomycetota bacterium]|jgi:hypothetical protein
MKTEEKRSDEGKYEEKCCESTGDSKMAECCESMGGDGDCRSRMGECMMECRWFPLIPVVLGILLLLLGYYLNTEITRILWMIAAGFVILMGTFGLLMMSKMKTICHSSE